MRFKNRHEAGLELLPLLRKYKNESTVLLAIPGGGVPVAYPIAKELNLPLELLMTKKIGHPINKEFAIGAVSLEDHTVDKSLHIPESYINAEIEKIRQALKARYHKLMEERSPTDLKNKTIIIIDDGIATGNTILSSIEMLRNQKPKKIIVAVPVAPSQTVDKIISKVDELIYLYIPDPFLSVGFHYIDYSQVSDDEVRELLREFSHSE
jgi:putative phosphoribosyl transferase